MRYAVRIKPDFDFATALTIVEGFGTVYVTIPEISLIGLDADPSAIAYLRDYAGVEQITEDVTVHPSGAPPNDPAWSEMWFASALGLLDVWDITTGAGVKIAVLDSGVNATHVDFSGKLLPGWCVITNTDDVSSVHAHGTYTTSIAVGNANNAAGVVGIAHGSMGIPVRVSTASDGSSSDVYLAAGVMKAVELGADVISVSYVGLVESPSFLLAAEHARRKGVTVVGSMPNTAGAVTVPTSSGKDVIFVSGINSSFNRVNSSGEVLWLRAPQGIPAASGTSSSYISSFIGNSAAAPVVAGVCALILSVRPDLGPADVRQILAQSGNKSIIVGSNGGYTTLDGHGLVDALGAINLANTWTSVGAGSPSVVIVEPRGDETFFGVDTPISVEVVARDDVGISKVELYNNNTLLDTLYAPPFVFAVDNLVGGLSRLKAIAYDDLGQNSQEARLWVRYSAQSVQPVSALSLEHMLPELTGNLEYEVRARFYNLGGYGPWSNWLEYIAPDDPLSAVPDHFIELSDDQWKVHYSSPHAGQRLEYRFAGGAWAQVTQSPFTFSGLSGYGALEFRMSNLTSSTASVLVGQFNLNRVYYVIYEGHLAQPTAEQVLNGQNALGQAATASGSEAAPTTTALQQFLSAATGLTPNTSYRIAFVGTDGVGLSEVAVSDPWTTLAASANLAVLDATHAIASGEPALVSASTLAAGNAQHAQEGQAPTLSVGLSVVPSSAEHAHSATGPELGTAILLGASGGAHAHSSTDAALTYTVSLTSSDANHVTTSDDLVANTGSSLATSDGAHAHSATTPELAASSLLGSDGAQHAQAVDTLGLQSASTLTTGSAQHAQQADTTIPTAGLNVNLDSAQHAQHADNLEAYSGLSLGAQDVLHAHEADSPVAGSQSLLHLSQGMHGHAADAATLTSAHALQAENANHSHGAENAEFISGSSVEAQGTAHAHAASSVALATAKSLVLGSSAHVHGAESATLESATTLSTGDATHEHGAESGEWVTGLVLNAQATNHAHEVQTPTVTTSASLWALNAAHSHIAPGMALAAALSVLADSAVHAQLAQAADLSTSVAVPIDPQNALHGQVSDAAQLLAALTFAPAGATHGLTSSVVLPTATHTFQVSENTHTAYSDTVAAAIGYAMTVLDVLHEQVAQGVALSTALSLAVQAAEHAHSVDDSALSAWMSLLVQDAIQDLTSSGVQLYLPVPLAELIRRSVFLRIVESPVFAMRQQGQAYTVVRDQRVFTSIEEQHAFVRV